MFRHPAGCSTTAGLSPPAGGAAPVCCSAVPSPHAFKARQSPESPTPAAAVEPGKLAPSTASPDARGHLQSAGVACRTKGKEPRAQARPSRAAARRRNQRKPALRYGEEPQVMLSSFLIFWLPCESEALAALLETPPLSSSRSEMADVPISGLRTPFSSSTRVRSRPIPPGPASPAASSAKCSCAGERQEGRRSGGEECRQSSAAVHASLQERARHRGEGSRARAGERAGACGCAVLQELPRASAQGAATARPCPPPSRPSWCTRSLTTRCSCAAARASSP